MKGLALLTFSLKCPLLSLADVLPPEMEEKLPIANVPVTTTYVTFTYLDSTIIGEERL